MTTTAFILARAGSKGLPGKNIRPLKNKPLIVWTIEAAQACADIDDIIVSTDGDDIANVARNAGAEVMMRPSELSGDTAMPKDAIRYHLADLKNQGRYPEITVLLQPTSPMRTAEDIQNCLNKITRDRVDSVATFMESPSSPYRAWKTLADGSITPFIDGFDPWKPRQSLPKTYSLNGAVYAVRTDIFLADLSQSFLPGKRAMVMMPRDRSVDIDTQFDLDIASLL